MQMTPEICQAVAANLAIGVKINLEAETKGTYFPRSCAATPASYMLGWTANTVDAHNVMYPILSTPVMVGEASSIWGRTAMPRVDELTNAVASRPTRRSATT